MFKQCCFILVCIFCCANLSAQTAPEQGFFVCKDGKWGAIDITGKVVVPLMYESVESVPKNNKILNQESMNTEFYESFERTSDEIIEYEDEIFPMYSDLRALKKNGKWGIADYNSIPVDYCFDSAEELNKEAIAFSKQGKYFINNDKTPFDEVEDYGAGGMYDGLLRVKKDGKTCIYLTKDESFFPMDKLSEYDEFGTLYGAQGLLVSNDKGSGFIDKEGNVVIKCGEYDDFEVIPSR